ncbi:hypothetical protein IMSAGC005_00882 [Lachnospiraceae bacterium]|nr:hypothetical protein IMSAGC005_00882 [Lachnospiraceae bacterium]
MNITKKQHYVSQGILKHFLNDQGKVFELLIEKKLIIPKRIQDTMEQNYVYEHPAFETNMLERKFGEIESVIFPRMDRIIADLEGAYKDDKSAVKYIGEIKKMMSLLLVFYFRSGALLYEYEFSSDKPKLDRVERLIANIFNSRYINGLCQTVCNCYEAAIIVDETEQFLISDQYMSTVALKYKNRFSNASNRQIGMKETMILLPLSAKFYMVFYNGHIPSYIIKDKISILMLEEVQKINNVIIRNCYVECVGKYKQELDRVKEDEIISFGPSKCLMRYSDGTLKDHIIKREVFFYEEDWDLDRNSYTYMVKYLEKIKGKIGRNSLCICGSGKKYKHCCMHKYDLAKNILFATQNEGAVNYNISGATAFEVAIEEFAGKETELTNQRDKEALKKIDELMEEQKRG